MLTDEKIEDVLLTFDVMNPKDPWWHDLAKALIAEAQPAIEQAARVEALEDAAKLCEKIADEYHSNEYHSYPELKTDAERGSYSCEYAIRALINKEQAQ